VLTFRSRPPGYQLAVTRGSRSAIPEARGPTDLQAGHDGRPYIGDSTCGAGCGPLAPSGRGPRQEAELVSLIVVPKVSGKTRRSSLAFGTRRRSAAEAGRAAASGRLLWRGSEYLSAMKSSAHAENSALPVRIFMRLPACSLATLRADRRPRRSATQHRNSYPGRADRRLGAGRSLTGREEETTQIIQFGAGGCLRAGRVSAAGSSSTRWKLRSSVPRTGPASPRSADDGV
jgi:hypothetical protein